METVKTFSDDIHMEFGLERCAKIAFKRDKLFHSQNLVIEINREIQELEQGKTYKYLGIEEIEGIQHQRMKERLKQEYSIHSICMFMYCSFASIGHADIMWATVSSNVCKVCTCYLSLC